MSITTDTLHVLLLVLSTLVAGFCAGDLWRRSSDLRSGDVTVRIRRMR